MKTARTCLAMVAALALAGTASAQSFTEDWDGANGSWGDSATVAGTNNWVANTNYRTTTATGGYRGTRGATYTESGAEIAIDLTHYGFSTPITSGTISIYALIDASGGTGLGAGNRAPQIGLSSGAGRPFTNKVEFEINSLAGKYEITGAGTNDVTDLAANKFHEYNLIYDRTNSIVSGRIRDVDDVTGALGPWQNHTLTATATQDVQYLYLRGFHAGDGIGGIYDRISTTPLPEPATAGLFAIAGLTFLRRRRA